MTNKELNVIIIVSNSQKEPHTLPSQHDLLPVHCPVITFYTHFTDKCNNSNIHLVLLRLRTHMRHPIAHPHR